MYFNLLDVINNRRNNHSSHWGTFDEFYRHMCFDKEIWDILDFELPEIESIGNRICPANGGVHALRLDALGGGIGHKKIVVGALILYHLCRIFFRDPECAINKCKKYKGIIDAGNVSSALAIAFYGKRLGIKSSIVMSRFFPSDVVDFIQNFREWGIQVKKAPPEEQLGAEMEFYGHLCSVVKKGSEFENYLPLWHPKYAGLALVPFGEMLANKISKKFDDIVFSIGAGATLSGWVMPLKRIMLGNTLLTAIEHELCPLINLPTNLIRFIRLDLPEIYDTKWLRSPPSKIPHAVIGPHYHDLNPFISSKDLGCIDSIARYSENDWKQMASHCKQVGLSVGNSSSANLMVSAALAGGDRQVLTFIYESRRPYYEAESAGSVQKDFSSSNVSSNHTLNLRVQCC